MKRIQLSTNRRMDKYIVVYSHNVLRPHKKITCHVHQCHVQQSECISDILVSKRRQIQKNPFHFSVLDECNAFIYHYIYWVGQIYKIQNSQIYLFIEVEHLWWWGDRMMKIAKSVLSDGYTGYIHP